MDTLINLYNNFYDWYIALWYNMLGNDGVDVVRMIICGITLLGLALMVTSYASEVIKVRRQNK